MQSMMANVNALNENQNMLGQQRIAAQGMQNTAKDAAFAAYNAEVGVRGQSAAAFSAADAGNAWTLAQQIKAANPGMSDNEALSRANGSYNIGS
jgi:hypothetical protein